MSTRVLVLSAVIVALGTAAVFLVGRYRPASVRAARVFAWMRAPDPASPLVMHMGTTCGDAPFVFPTTGVVGFIWGDSFRLGHRHQGIDIFAGTDVDVTPVIAAYAGFLTRLPDWKSTVIVRVPEDPIHQGQQVWVYYTHMADPNGNSFVSDEFPPGTYERPVEAGTVLGREGDYSGDPNNPVGVHLHVSIVKDKGGSFMNELDINNTYDPSPYFGLPLNAAANRDRIPVCEASPAP